MPVITYDKQIDYEGNAYLDPKMVPVQTHEDMFNIPFSNRFEGLKCTVKEDSENNNKQTEYWLDGGIENENWVRATSDGVIYTGGTGIDIDDTVISSNTDATTVRNISITEGAPIDARNIFDDNVIPEGTSVQTILERLLCRELFPSAATLPSITINGTADRGLFTLGKKITIAEITYTTNIGQYNASFETPSQPEPSGVTWSDTKLKITSKKNFDGYYDLNTENDTKFASKENVVVALGENVVTYTAYGKYTKPSNMPISNLSHPTQSTSKISIDGSDITAIWGVNDNYSITGSTTATGVYPCYTNISGETLVESGVATQCTLQTSKIIEISNVPTEVGQSNRFKFSFPSTSHSVTKLEAYNALTRTYDTVGTSSYAFTDEFNHVINGTSYKYKTLYLTAPEASVPKYKITLSKNLNE